MTSMRGERSIATIDANRDLFAARPSDRLAAAAALHGRARRKLEKKSVRWPAYSAGSVHAWLLFVTTKPPSWRDPLVTWPDEAPTIGTAHPGFFYPDPLGFWAEVRRWSHVLVGSSWPGASVAEALAVSALVHGTEVASAIADARKTMRPGVILFLDEPAWTGAGLVLRDPHRHRIPDPHRAGQVYEGFWGTLDDGTVVGKSPQHPAAHKLYRAADTDAYLRCAPLPRV